MSCPDVELAFSPSKPAARSQAASSSSNAARNGCWTWRSAPRAGGGERRPRGSRSHQRRSRASRSGPHRRERSREITHVTWRD